LRNTQQPLLAICVGPVVEQVFAPAASVVSQAGAAPVAASVPAPLAPKKGSQPARTARATRAIAQR
jgi:hypothetical protein